MNRYKAFLAHLGISASIVGVFLLLTFFVWYPSPLFTIEGTQFPIQILVAVDVILGPLLTLIVFKPGKPRLKMDLSIIAAVQLTAFIYGASVVFTERPAFVAFTLDRFVIVPAADTEKMDLNKLDTEKVKISTFGPTYVYAELPTDQQTREKIMFEVFDGKPDIDRRPEYYKDFSSNVEKSYRRSMNLELYGEKYKEFLPAINAFYKKTGKTSSDIAAYPTFGKHHNVFMVVDKSTKKIIGSIDINPWLPITIKKEVEEKEKKTP